MGNMCILISVLDEPPLIVLNGPVHFSAKYLSRFSMLLTKIKNKIFLNLNELWKCELGNIPNELIYFVNEDLSTLIIYILRY